MHFSTFSFAALAPFVAIRPTVLFVLSHWICYGRFNKKLQAVILINNRRETLTVDLPIWQIGILENYTHWFFMLFSFLLRFSRQYTHLLSAVLQSHEEYHPRHAP